MALIQWWWAAPALIVGLAASVRFAAGHNRNQRFVTLYVETLFSIILALTLLLVAVALFAWAASKMFSVVNFTMIRVAGLSHVLELAKASIAQCREHQATVDCGLLGSLLIAVAGAGLLAGTIATGAGLLIADLFNRCYKARE